MTRRWDPTLQQYVDDAAPSGGTGGNVTPLPSISSIAPALGINTDADYDPNYDAAMAAVNAKRNQAETDYTFGENQLNTQYQPQYDMLAQQQERASKQLTNQMANNGMYRSGNYLSGIGDLGNQFAGVVGNLQGQQKSQLQDLIRQRLGLETQAGSEEQAAETAHAGVRAEYAKNRAQAQADTEAAQQAAQVLAQQNALAAGPQTNSTGQYEQPGGQTLAQPGQPAGPGQVTPAYSTNPAENTMQDWFNEMQRWQDNPLMMNRALEVFNQSWGNNPMFANMQQDPRMLEIRRRLGLQ